MSEPSSKRATKSYFRFHDHPLRAALSSEMHGRKLPSINAPARAMQVIIASRNDDIEVELNRLRMIAPKSGRIDANSRYLRARLADLHVIWERHTEFSSYMFIRFGRGSSHFDSEDFSFLPADWFANLPGEVVRATKVEILDADDQAVVERYFVPEDLVHCEVLDGRAAIWSDFRLNEDGCGRLLVVTRGATPSELALAVQRLQELGNYRNLSLLGLPLAQRLNGQLTEVELHLSATAQKISTGGEPDEVLLRTLCDISSRIAQITAETHYRMSASRAYAEMVDDRLRALRIGRIPGYQTLGDFTERRLHPAVRTCVSFSNRLEALAQRAAWTSSLQRTRVDTELSIQNRDLLSSMNRRTALQLRLQSTVEGISVVAISYYAVGLAGYVLRAFPFVDEYYHALIMAISVPVILALVSLGLHRIRRQLDG